MSTFFALQIDIKGDNGFPMPPENIHAMSLEQLDKCLPTELGEYQANPSRKAAERLVAMTDLIRNAALSRYQVDVGLLPGRGWSWESVDCTSHAKPMEALLKVLQAKEENANGDWKPVYQALIDRIRLNTTTIQNLRFP